MDPRSAYQKDIGTQMQRGIILPKGFPTGFRANWVSGGPVIAVQTEYDANPDNLQKPGATKQEAIIEGLPGIARDIILTPQS